jgi:hypothetical protein
MMACATSNAVNTDKTEDLIVKENKLLLSRQRPADDFVD